MSDISLKTPFIFALTGRHSHLKSQQNPVISVNLFSFESFGNCEVSIEIPSGWFIRIELHQKTSYKTVQRQTDAQTTSMKCLCSILHVQANVNVECTEVYFQVLYYVCLLPKHSESTKVCVCVWIEALNVHSTKIGGVQGSSTYVNMFGAHNVHSHILLWLFPSSSRFCIDLLGMHNCIFISLAYTVIIVSKCTKICGIRKEKWETIKKKLLIIIIISENCANIDIKQFTTHLAFIVNDPTPRNHSANIPPLNTAMFFGLCCCCCSCFFCFSHLQPWNEHFEFRSER